MYRITIGWLAAVLFISLIVPNHYSPWLSFHQEFLAAVAFAPLSIVLIARFKASPSGVGVILLLLSSVPIIQFALGQLNWFSDAALSAAYLSSFALLAVGASHLKNHYGTTEEFTRASEAIWGALLAAALLSCGIALIQWLGLGSGGILLVEIPLGMRPGGNLAQANHLASLILLGVLAVWYFIETKNVRLWYACSGLLILLIGLVIAASRSTLIALMAIVIGFLILRQRVILNTSPWAIFSFIAVFLVFSAAMPWFVDVIHLSTSGSSAFERMTELGVRQIMWRSMSNAIFMHPWIGHGWGQIAAAQSQVALYYPATYALSDSAHNIILDLALWQGIPLTIIAMSVLLIAFFKGAVKCGSPIELMALLGFGVLLNHSMFEYPLRYLYFLLPAGWWLGSLEKRSMMQATATSKAIENLFRVTNIAVLVVLLTTLVVVAKDYMKIEQSWRSMLFNDAGIGNAATQIWDYTPLTDAPAAYIKASLVSVDTAMAQKDIELLRTTTERYPYATAMYRYALAQALNDDAPGAHLTSLLYCKMQTMTACENAKTRWALASNTLPAMAKINFGVESK